jgi:hypothetical protein
MTQRQITCNPSYTARSRYNPVPYRSAVWVNAEETRPGLFCHSIRWLGGRSKMSDQGAIKGCLGAVSRMNIHEPPVARTRSRA